MKFFVKFLFLVVSLILATASVFAYLTLDQRSLVTQQHQVTPAHADNSKRLAKRLYRTLKYSEKQSVLILSQEEIDGLTALLHRAQSSTKMDITLSEHGAVLLSSIQLPVPVSRLYLNIKATLLPSSQGVELSSVNIGDISLSGDTAISILTKLIDWYAGEQTTEKLLATVQSVAMSPRQIFVTTNMSQDLLAMDTEHSLFNKLRDDLALLGEPKLINYYYTKLRSFGLQQPYRLSLSRFISYLFHETHKQNSLISPESFVAQNRAMLVALSLYFTHDRLALLVGGIDPLSLEEKRQQNIHRYTVILANRSDLQQHFMYSVILQLLSNVQMSDALGEFKELLDTNEGGSGFSFADLMADRAGTRLAMMATYSEFQAKEIQSLLAKITDKTLLPTINNLAEELNEHAFNQEYQNVESTHYQQAITTIENRLKTLPLYQFNWR